MVEGKSFNPEKRGGKLGERSCANEEGGNVASMRPERRRRVKKVMGKNSE